MIKQKVLIKVLMIGLVVTLLPACAGKQSLSDDILNTQITRTVLDETTQTNEEDQIQTEAIAAQKEMYNQNSGESDEQERVSSNHSEHNSEETNEHSTGTDEGLNTGTADEKEVDTDEEHNSEETNEQETDTNNQLANVQDDCSGDPATLPTRCVD